MLNRRSLPFFALLGLLSVAACGQDDTGQIGEPAGMGAGRPDTTELGTAGEVPAPAVLDGADVMVGTQQDTAPRDTGAPR